MSNGGPYTLVTSYEGDAFFDGWTFWADAGASAFLDLPKLDRAA